MCPHSQNIRPLCFFMSLSVLWRPPEGSSCQSGPGKKSLPCSLQLADGLRCVHREDGTRRHTPNGPPAGRAVAENQNSYKPAIAEQVLLAVFAGARRPFAPPVLFVAWSICMDSVSLSPFLHIPKTPHFFAHAGPLFFPSRTPPPGAAFCGFCPPLAYPPMGPSDFPFSSPTQWTSPSHQPPDSLDRSRSSGLRTMASSRAHGEASTSLPPPSEARRPVRDRDDDHEKDQRRGGVDPGTVHYQCDGDTRMLMEVMVQCMGKQA